MTPLYDTQHALTKYIIYSACIAIFIRICFLMWNSFILFVSTYIPRARTLTFTSSTWLMFRSSGKVSGRTLEGRRWKRQNNSSRYISSAAAAGSARAKWKHTPSLSSFTIARVPFAKLICCWRLAHMHYTDTTTVYIGTCFIDLDFASRKNY